MITVLAGMPAPVTLSPTTSPAVLDNPVRWLLPGVAPAVSVGACRSDRVAWYFEKDRVVSREPEDPVET